MDTVRTEKQFHKSMEKNSYGKNLSMHFNIKKYLKYLWSVFRACLLVGLGFVLLYPVIYMFSIAFRPTAEVMDPSIVWIPRHFTLDNFTMVMKAMNYPTPLINTLTIGIVSSILQICSCALIGYGFARFRFKGRNLLFAMLLFTIIVPPQTITVPMYIQFKNFDFFGVLKLFGILTGGPSSINILDTRFVFYVPSVLGMGIRSGLYIYVYRQFFRGMPKELEDSALIDGCGSFQTFIRIMIPNAAAVFLTVFLFSIVWHWNDYFYSVMYLGTKPTVATALASLRQTLQSQGVNIYDPFELVTRLQTGSLVTIIPLLIMYIFSQRYFTESIERTGIVG